MKTINHKGFTLIELLVVIAIIAILGAVAIPGYIGQTKRAARTEAYSNLETLRLLEEQYFAENGRYAPDPDGALTGAAAIQTALSGFKPGPEANLNFTYTLTSSSGGTEFDAVAAGKTGSRVDGESYSINELNERDF